MKTWYEYQTCLGSENGRVKNMEESEGQDFLKVLQNEARKKKSELKASTTEELLEIQKVQLKSLENSEKKQQDFLEKNN